ncbi:MAG: HAMP domain-containing sensor histidine kinase [Pseudomonadota bacterium]
MSRTHAEQMRATPEDRQTTTIGPATPSPPHMSKTHAEPNAAGFALNDFGRAGLDWAWTCDERLCITDISEGYTAMTGLLPSMLKGAPLEQLGTFADQHPGQNFAALASGKSLRDVPFAVNTATHPVPVELSAVPILNASKQMIGVEGGVVRRYVAPAQPMEDDAQMTAQQLKLAHQVQHELRTPLNAIVGFAQIIRDDLQGRADGRYAAYCDDILSASNHLLGLIDDLVGAHGAQQSALTAPSTNAFSLAGFLDEVGRMLLPSAGQHGQELVIDAVDPELHYATDRRRLKQMCVNLLENAVKFTPHGGRLGISVNTAVPGLLDITIWDEGAGISKEDQALIWRRFEKGSSKTSLTSSSPGLGLGLSVVAALAESIGAELILDSEIGRGSQFTIRLPRVAER